ncbi:MAG TPA: RNA methyltransferase [Bacteroidia bacterium]|nr:RNA methyltransferase [Bacteroidia bacterium]
MTTKNISELIEHLSKFISDNRKKKFLEVLEFRTRHITIVMEDIYQAHNASAVLRSCDCFGIQDVHIIENKNKYSINPDVALGSSKWVNLIKYNQAENNTLEALQNLKKNGYRIVATSPHANDCNLEDLNIDNKTALVFGTELLGISEEVKKNADEFVKIPMYGFTESFNISVSAALCLHTISEKLHKSKIDWKLSQSEKEIILLDWLRNSINKPELIEKEFLKNK